MSSPEGSSVTFRRVPPTLRRAPIQRFAGTLQREVVKNRSFDILITGDAELRRLNRDFRGKDKATNVLSFPGSDGYAGDIAIAHGVTRAEAKAAGKIFADHAAHLVVHGVLHLAGYDHERPKDAQVMEPLEVKILARLGIADPYRAAL